MLFNSFAYVLFFLPAVAVVHALLRAWAGPRAAQIWLLLSSLVFYAWSKPAHLPLLAGSIAANWALARYMSAQADEKRRRRVLQLGLVLNVAFLCLFKYARFFFRGLFALGVPKLELPQWEFPLGISFFTIQQIMYLVDCYEGLVPASGLLDHAAFVSFFPYVTSGPLAKAKSIVKQFAEPGPSGGPERFDAVARGLFLFALGLGKKVVFADSFGRVADLGYDAAAGWSTLEAWVFSLAYTFQIYFDFSGYSDMAMGSAQILGIEIPRNFDCPYRSRTVTEFWKRWHISLSNFITTYLYTPILQKFQKATLATSAIATLLAMTIAGLWHGPSWTYIVFGMLHGAALVTNQVWKKRKMKLPAPLAWALTFGFVNLAFIFFRSPDLTTAAHIVTRLVPLPGHGLLGRAVLSDVRTIGISTLAPPLLAGVVAAFVGKNSNDLTRTFRPTLVTAGGATALFLLSFLYMNSNIVKRFVYFNF
jgi:D-alanyl-lipoteichoic acid acyltransferase DltB (MBOAT superfamily)